MFFNKKDKVNSKKTLRIIPLAGQSHAYMMNCWLYEYGNTRIMIDCGIAIGSDTTAERIVPNFSYLKGKKLDAVLFTHWHYDHVHALPFVWKELGKPMIYATPMTAAKIQNTADEDVPDVGKIKTTIIPPTGKRFKIGDFDIEFIHSTHHTPQSSMIALRTPVGTTLHTGDWTLNPHPNVEPKTNEQQLKDLNKENFLAIVGDSTEIYRKTTTYGEDVVSENLLKYFKKAKGKIIVPLFSSTIGRIQNIYDVAQKIGREVCVIGRSVETNVRIAKECGFLKNCDFIPFQKARALPENQVIYIVTGCQGEPMAVLPRIIRDAYKGLHLTNRDMVLFSSSLIPGTEHNVLPMHDKIVEKHVTLVTLDDDVVHAHGHGGYHDFVRFYKDIVKPKYVIPTHGDAMSQIQHGELAKKYGVKDAIHVKNGDVLELTSDLAPQIIDHIDVNPTAMEGPFKISTNDPIFKNRAKVFYEGAVFVSLRLDKKGLFIGHPIISSLGVFETAGGEFIKKEIILSIVKDIKSIPVKNTNNRSLLIQTTNSAIRKAMKPYFSRFKRPKIVIHFIEG